MDYPITSFAVVSHDDVATEVGRDKVQIDLGGSTEIGERSITASLFRPDHAAFAVEIGATKAKSDRPIQIDECLIQCPLAPPQDCPVTKYGRVIRINADRLIIVSERALEGAYFVESIAADIVGFHVIGIEPNSLIEFDDRIGEITAAVCGDCALSIEIDIARYDFGRGRPPKGFWFVSVRWVGRHHQLGARRLVGSARVVHVCDQRNDGGRGQGRKQPISADQRRYDGNRDGGARRLRPMSPTLELLQLIIGRRRLYLAKVGTLQQLIVDRPLLCIAKDGIRGDNLPESKRSIRVFGMEVRMIRPGCATERFLKSRSVVTSPRTDQIVERFLRRAF